MPELIINCGLMGCGKTYFAKKYAKKFGYKYINFDREYHYKIQEEQNINSQKLIFLFLEKISKILNNNPNKNFICDNWFKWHRDWWMDEEDNTLQELKKKLKFHEIKVFLMIIPFEKAYEGYLQKDKEKNLIKLENYKENRDKKLENLFLKISKWAIQ